MSIPAKITAELTALQAQLTAAEPIQSASQPTVVAIQLNAEQLLTDIGIALTAAAGSLDTWVAPVDPQQIVNGILGLGASADDQSSLADSVGYVGRALVCR